MRGSNSLAECSEICLRWQITFCQAYSISRFRSQREEPVKEIHKSGIDVAQFPLLIQFGMYGVVAFSINWKYVREQDSSG